jgi:hypothetical protein
VLYLSLVVVKIFRKKFAKQLAKLNPAYNKKIPFKLDDNEDFGAFEGELKAFVPHGLGRHVKPDGSCWVLLRECYIELIRSSGTVYEGYWRKGQYHGTGESSFVFCFRRFRGCYLYFNNLLGCLSNPVTGLLHRGEFKLGCFHGPGISYHMDGSFDDSIWNFGIKEEQQTLMCV